jgi:hypothetical protein
MHAPRDRPLAPSDPSGFRFDPVLDSILPVDECWLVDPRLLAHRADLAGNYDFEQAYAASVDALAELGFGCVPDPATGDAPPAALAGTCIVYAIDPSRLKRDADAVNELHLRLVCAMARSDGAFVGSELAVALELADRLAAGDEGRRLRGRALARDLFITPAPSPGALVSLTLMPREDALEIVETLKATAWADGYLRRAEQQMLTRIHELLDLPLELVGALSTRSVDRLAA